MDGRGRRFVTEAGSGVEADGLRPARRDPQQHGFVADSLAVAGGECSAQRALPPFELQASARSSISW